MQVRQIKIFVSLLVIFVAGLILFSHYFEPTPKVEARPHLAIGEALVEQTIKALGKGGRITLIAPDTAIARHPGAEVQLMAFHQGLRQAQLSVAATNRVKLDPLRPVRAPSGDFADILRKQLEGDVVVSLLGPPLLSQEQKARVGEKRPRVIAVCSGDMPRYVNLKALFEDNFLYAAIISRPAPGTPAQSENLSQWFDHYFKWITAQNLADLPGEELAGK
jgi:hypothetical protein